MWNEKELLNELRSYFDNITEQEFLVDLKKAGCEEYIEDEPYVFGLVGFSACNEVKVEKRFDKLSKKFHDKSKQIETSNYIHTGNVDNLAIGA